MLALVKAELHARARSVAALAGGSFVLLLVLAGTYSAYGGEKAFGKAFGSGHAPSLFSAFAGTSDVNIFAPASFLSFGFTHPLFLVLALAGAVSVGVGAVAGDVESGRAELLYSLPVRRTLIYDARAIAGAMAVVAVVSAAVIGAEVGRLVSRDLSDVSPLVPLRVAVQLLPLLALFAAIAFTASAMCRTRSEAMGLAVAAPAAAYLANVVSLLWSRASFVGRIDPFHYFQATRAATAISGRDAAGLLIGSGIVYFVGRAWLGRRDLA
ncbi:MAG TPA: ABC transporter permease subunit [Mycobacteriales bacterium]|nr:ABC transporter permease subunit [Mycobacteriales bacterium]